VDPCLALHTTRPSHQRYWFLIVGFSSFVWLVYWLEAFNCRDIVLKYLHSALNTETPPFGLSFAKTEWKPHNYSIVSTLIQDSASPILGVQSFNLSDCQAGGYDDRSGSEDAFVQTWNPIRRHDDVQSLTQSTINHHQCDDAATDRFFQSRSLFCSSCWFKVCYFFKVSGTIFVDLLVLNQLKTSFWQWNSYRYFSMYSIVA